MVIIGESINGTIQKVGHAIIERDAGFIRELADIQYKAGAHFLDINAGVAGGNEVEDLPWVLQVVQDTVPLPLMIDSPNPEAIKAALCEYRNEEAPIINSLSGEETKLSELAPLIAEKKCRVVVLCMDDKGIPSTNHERVAIGGQVHDKLTDAGIPEDFIYFDVLLLSVAVDPETALVTLETIRSLKSIFPDSHYICGTSNVSMGLPGRKLINRTFISMAMFAGLDSLLVDVRDLASMSAIHASRLLLNQDSYCQEYIRAFREKKLLL